MLVKGSKDYKKAQELANELVNIADYERRNNNSIFESYFNQLGSFLSRIESLDVFASKIAKSIDDKMNPYGFKVAYISSKQAWILACASIENNVEL